MNLPANASNEDSLSLQTFRLDCGEMVHDPVRGDWVRLQEARRAHNQMASQLVSLAHGTMTQLEVRQAHMYRGDVMRVWEMIKDPGAAKWNSSTKDDIFQRIGKLMDALRAQQDEIDRLKAQLMDARTQNTKLVRQLLGPPIDVPLIPGPGSEATDL